MVSDNQSVSGSAWEDLPDPPPGHPEAELLQQAQETLLDIAELSEQPTTKDAFVRRLAEYAEGIVEASRPIQTTEHSIAFMGNIGVGKTTAMCRIIALETPSLRGLTTPDPVLEVGAGGTTVCEVSVVQGAGHAIRIKPRSDDEVRREVREFASYHLEALGNSEMEETEEADSHGTSKEIERAIRNMSDLPVRRDRQSDGSRVRVDDARLLAQNFPDVAPLADEILRRMNLPERTRSELVYSQESGSSPLLWISEVFRQVNNGRHPEFSMPVHIEVEVPRPILAHESLSIRVVDTKGIDDTAERDDLESHIREPNTVVILCSSFNDAPSPSVQQLLRSGMDGQFPGLEDKVAVLPLPRPNEALAVKDDQGFTVDSPEEGYELKTDQAETRLNVQHLPYAGIQCFNVHEDDPAAIQGFLLGLVVHLRQRHSERLEESISAANALVQNFEAEQASEVLRQASRYLSVWVQNNGEIESLTKNLQDSLLQALPAVHVSSLRASINREGAWLKLDYSYHLAHGARLMAIDALAGKVQDFQAVTQNLLNDPQMDGANGLIQQSRSILESGHRGILVRIESRARDFHTRTLEIDEDFWNSCRGEWGRGPGYRDRVAGHHHSWFESQSDLAGEFRAFIEAEWGRVLGRIAAILPTD